MASVMASEVIRGSGPRTAGPRYAADRARARPQGVGRDGGGPRRRRPGPDRPKGRHRREALRAAPPPLLPLPHLRPPAPGAGEARRAVALRRPPVAARGARAAAAAGLRRAPLGPPDRRPRGTGRDRRAPHPGALLRRGAAALAAGAPPLGGRPAGLVAAGPAAPRGRLRLRRL